MLFRPHHLVDNGTRIDLNSSRIFQWSTSVLSESPLQSVTLPVIDPSHRLHLFGMVFSPSTSPSANSTGPVVAVRRARFTSRWEDFNGTRAQAVQVTLANLLPSVALSTNTSLNGNFSVEISGPGIHLVSPGTIHRLTPGDQATTDVYITGSRNGTNATVTLKNGDGNVVGTSSGWPASPLIQSWTADGSVLGAHETPTWVRLHSLLLLPYATYASPVESGEIWYLVCATLA
jgi:alpha-L-fucosidase